MTIDYKVLLQKYMAHIIVFEGIDYVDKLDPEYLEIDITPEEIAELERISGDGCAPWIKPNRPARSE